MTHLCKPGPSRIGHPQDQQVEVPRQHTRTSLAAHRVQTILFRRHLNVRKTHWSDRHCMLGDHSRRDIKERETDAAKTKMMRINSGSMRVRLVGVVKGAIPAVFLVFATTNASSLSLDGGNTRASRNCSFTLHAGSSASLGCDRHEAKSEDCLLSWLRP